MGTKNVKEQHYSYETILTFAGKKQTIFEWACELRIHAFTIMRRLERGWTVREALGTEKMTARYIVYQGRKQTVSDWANEKGMSRITLTQRLRNGWSVEKALETPVKRSGKGKNPDVLEDYSHIFKKYKK